MPDPPAVPYCRLTTIPHHGHKDNCRSRRNRLSCPPGACVGIGLSRRSPYIDGAHSHEHEWRSRLHLARLGHTTCRAETRSARSARRSPVSALWSVHAGRCIPFGVLRSLLRSAYTETHSRSPSSSASARASGSDVGIPSSVDLSAFARSSSNIASAPLSSPCCLQLPLGLSLRRPCLRNVRRTRRRRRRRLPDVQV